MEAAPLSAAGAAATWMGPHVVGTPAHGTAPAADENRAPTSVSPSLAGDGSRPPTTIFDGQECASSMAPNKLIPQDNMTSTAQL